MNLRPTSAHPYHKHQTTAIKCYAYYLLGESKDDQVGQMNRRPATLVSFVFPVSPGKVTLQLNRRIVTSWKTLCCLLCQGFVVENHFFQLLSQYMFWLCPASLLLQRAWTEFQEFVDTIKINDNWTVLFWELTKLLPHARF